jgi:hypothetical protein
MPQHQFEGQRRRVDPEIVGHIANDNPLVRIGLPSSKLPSRQLRTDRLPPGSSGGLMDGKIRVGDKIQRENLLRDCFLKIGLDRERPIEMRDRGVDLAEFSVTASQHHQRDFGSRILLEHLVAGGDGPGDITREESDLRPASPSRFQFAIDGEGGIKIGFGLRELPELRMHPATIGQDFRHSGVDRERRLERCLRRVEVAQIEAD